MNELKEAARTTELANAAEKKRIDAMNTKVIRKSVLILILDRFWLPVTLSACQCPTKQPFSVVHSPQPLT